MSKFIGQTVSSPFASIIYAEEYDYDDLIGEEGFFLGFKERVASAGSIENISEKDKTFHDICIKSSEIALQKNIINPGGWEEILDDLIELGLIKPQITFI